jgi:Protein of unknown function (DUF1573)/HYDIN/CFA65/VesB-like, Ig-like domain
MHSKTCRLLSAAFVLLWSDSIIGSAAGAVQSPSHTEAEARLRQRVSDYWTAMEKADYEAAVPFLHPDSRNQFRNKIPKSRVLKWKIEKLAFNEDRTVCDTVTVVTKPVPVLGETIDFPLHNRWELVNGEWYFRIPWGESDNPLLKVFQEQRSVAEQLPVDRSASPKIDQAAGRVMKEERQRIVPDPANPPSVFAGRKAVFRFLYPNAGTSPIQIVSVHADCHCTGAKKDYPEIAPGEVGILEVTLDTFGLPLGRIHKDISVQFAHLPDPLVVSLAVDSLPNFNLTPPAADFGSVPAGSVAQKEIRIVNNSGQPVRILSNFNSDPKLGFSLDRNKFASGETLVINISYNSDAVGEFIDNLLLKTDLEAEPLITIPVRGRIDLPNK